MATIAGKPEQDTILVEIHISASPERVFAAITDPRQLIQWWGQRDIYRGTKWETDLRPGGKWLCEGMGTDGTPFQVSGEYLELAPPRLVIYSWIASWTGGLKTTVRWDLESVDGGTQVTIRHSGFAGHPEARSHAQGWTRVVAWLQSFVEKGETVDSRGSD